MGQIIDIDELDIKNPHTAFLRNARLPFTDIAQEVHGAVIGQQCTCGNKPGNRWSSRWRTVTDFKPTKLGFDICVHFGHLSGKARSG